MKQYRQKLKSIFGQEFANLQYGREIIIEFTKEYVRKKNIHEVHLLDIGVGQGNDILNIKNNLDSSIELHVCGVESYPPYIQKAKEKGIKVYSIDVERDILPIKDNSLDIVIANQLLEHTKEWYWIFQEINRVLKDSGVFIIGVPNMVSWHERVRIMFGRAPNCLTLNGPHVRGITANDFVEFAENGNYFKCIKFRGSYFYGALNIKLNKFLAKVFPKLSVSLFFLLEKQKNGRFTKNLDKRLLETNFYRG